MRWNNIVRNLASGNAGRVILMDLELELRALGQARRNTLRQYGKTRQDEPSRTK